jgi:uncharacterized membrane protein YgcG
VAHQLRARPRRPPHPSRPAEPVSARRAGTRPPRPRLQMVPNTDIVVGDVMLVDTGDKIIADGVMVDGHNLVGKVGKWGPGPGKRARHACGGNSSGGGGGGGGGSSSGRGGKSSLRRAAGAPPH